MSHRIILKRGDKFNYLTFLNEEAPKKSGNAMIRMIRCRCECGKNVVVRLGAARYGSSKSCGCLALKVRTKHGLSTSRFYNIYKAMKRRCYSAKSNWYHVYGGKGIRVSKEWLCFDNFIRDMYQPYLDHVKEFGEADTTIERINGNKNYCKNNCRWATRLEQSNNTSFNHMLRHNGLNMSIADWARKLEMSPHTLRYRINSLKWSTKKSLTFKPVEGNNQFTK